MRILLFSDPHITPKSAFSRPTEDGLTTYLKQVKDTFLWLCRLVIAEQPDLVVCLGDVTETTGYVDAQTLKVATRCFMELSEASAQAVSPIHVLVGNHDVYSTQHTIHNLEFLRGMEQISISEKPEVISDFKNVFCLPWGSPKVEVPASAQVILSHIDIKGSMLYKGYCADSGAEPERFPLTVFNGHYHHPSTPHPNVHNIGALLSRTFKDTDSPPRGATIIQVGPSVAVEKFVPNPAEIAYKDVLIEDELAAAEIQQALEEGVTDLDNCFVRIKYKPEFKELAEQLSYLSQGARMEAIAGEIKMVSVPQLSKDHFSAEQAYTRYTLQSASHLAKLVQEALLSQGLEYLQRAASDVRAHTQPIEFERMTASYFQSLGAHFEFRLDQGGLWYVAGRNEDDPYDANGVGKSTIHEAIYWCCTGESLRGYKGDDVINWQHEWCAVSLWLKIGDRRYSITRARKDPTLGDAVQLWDLTEGRVDLGARRKHDTNELIAELIGRSKKVLQHSVFLTSGLAQRFTALNYPDRIRLVEEITDVGVFAKAGKLAEKDFEAEARKLQTLKGARDALQATLTRVDARLKTLEAEHAALSQSDEAHLDALRTQLETHRQASKTHEASVKDFDAQWRAVESKLLAMDRKLRAYSDDNTKLVAHLSSLETARSLLDARMLEAETLINSGKCPTCGQSISPEAPVCDALEVMRAEALELIGQLEPLQVKYQRLDESRSRLKMVLESDRNASQEILEQLENERDLLDVQNKAIMRLEMEISSTQSRLESAAATLQEQRTSKESTSKELEQTRRQIEVCTFRIEQLNWLVEAFSTTGVRADVLFQVSLPFLNSKILDYSDRLGQPCQLDYRQTKSGDLEEKVEVTLPGKKTYRGLSRGEKMMVDLSIQCALNDLAVATGGSHVNLLICDEVIDAIDEPTLKAFVEVLESKAGTMTIFLMAHRPFLDARLPNKLLLVKQGGITRLESEQ